VTFSPVNKQKLISSFFIYKLLLVIISFFGWYRSIWNQSSINITESYTMRM
jgi:hypothetical protein